MDIEERKLMQRLKRTMRSFAPKECLHPNRKACNGPIIHAHSIQENRYLRRIAEEGHVLMMDHDVIERPSLKKKGLKSATTFSGFCKSHDQHTFTAIEQQDLTAVTQWEGFLFAYRAFAREYSIKAMRQRMIQSQVLPFPHISNPVLMRLEAQGARDMALYKGRFDKALVEKNPDSLILHQRTIQGVFPVAVNACFSLDRDLGGDLLFDTLTMREPVPQFYFNLLPSSQSTTAVFAFFNVDVPKYDRMLRDVLAFPEDSFLSVISYWTVEYCENWAIKPSVVAAWSARKRQSVETRFYKSLGASDNYLTFAKEIGNLCEPN